MPTTDAAAAVSVVPLTRTPIFNLGNHGGLAVRRALACPSTDDTDELSRRRAHNRPSCSDEDAVMRTRKDPLGLPRWMDGWRTLGTMRAHFRDCMRK